MTRSSKIISIGTAVPECKHLQNDILRFMSRIYAFNEKERRTLKYLYHQSGIQSRYSVLSDYSDEPADWTFYPPAENLEPFPSIEERMKIFNRHAVGLSANAIRNCLENQMDIQEITHLITVTCTGLSAPGLDLQLMELLNLPKNIFRTSINFMGCYAAIHALKLADSLAQADPSAKILIVCTELCTLHFQQKATTNNITSSLLFGDGSAAVLITGAGNQSEGFPLIGFYGEVMPKGKQDMSWELSSTGFAMTLSSYVPSLIEEDFEKLVNQALTNHGLSRDQITHWSIHPGGKRILEVIEKSLSLPREKLEMSYQILREYGNMSSPTILFVLKEILTDLKKSQNQKVFGAAFGPGLTMETFIVGSPS
ncbi:MAG TPA: type III polyketide synthase [Puia sp.]